MGVPKFFRWQSQRYPCLSEVVKEHQLPEFDNLYLDMNGIIHPCSHPNDSDPHFRITEEDIFKNIFHYIEFLFRLIRPRKVFYMAVDGVAPRAKMNQQRGRRFRSAREAQDREREAMRRGERLPTEQRFDSNCITPGTGFMVRLNQQLQHFVLRKISDDPLWRGVRVILSGHDVPGEGEHKVMEFIRYEKSLADYDPNTRHCLYGLDADLIVLGLCTHEPHFSLLREEVLFTKQQTKRTTVPEEMKFYLLHLSLFREYLEYEFSDLKTRLSFGFDLEKIIDDWVALGFLVGNDFVPHLPNLHIKEDALPIIYSAYKRLLPTLDGYINEGGTLSLRRFEALMNMLSEWEMERLQDAAADKRWLAGKHTRDIRTAAQTKDKSKIKLRNQDDFEAFFDSGADCTDAAELEPRPAKPTSVFGEITTNIDSDLEDEDESLEELEYKQVRRAYYLDKMNIEINSESALRQAVEYVRAIQWILHYYFDGVCSWSWFYPSHYAPCVGDVRGFCDLPGVVDFDMAEPFLPYEQLLGVLPAASQECVPPCLRWLMTSESSPIIDYYPTNFESDLNGKQQDWEAVVLIPFIDQDRLLGALRPLYSRLSTEERTRNAHGDAFVYTYTPQDQGRTAAPQYFAPLERTFAVREPRPRAAFIVRRADLRKGLLPGTRLDLHFAGFPTLKHVPHTFQLRKAKVRVFTMASNSDSIILKVTAASARPPDAADAARRLLGTQLFVGWPHLVEARVTAVSCKECRYTLSAESEGGSVKTEPLADQERSVWIGQMHDVKNGYESRLGIETGEVTVLVHAAPLTGRKYVATAAGHVTLQKQWSPASQPFALQTCVRDIAAQDPQFVQFRTLAELLPAGAACFVLAAESYGVMGKVIGVTDTGRVRMDAVIHSEPSVARAEQLAARIRYLPGYVVAQRLGITSHLVSRLTGCILLQQGATKKPGQGNIVAELEELKPEREASFNAAVEIKNNKKNEEMPGWSRRVDDQWQYSGRLVDTLRQYIQLVPELVEFLGRNTEGYKFFEGDVWPDAELRAQRVRALKEWLAAQEFSRTERWPCGGAILEPAVVEALEAAVDAHRPTRAHSRLSVKPHLIYKPFLHGGSAVPDPAAQYRLFDRVVNVRESCGVPLGAKGTVTGIRESSVPSDVLYDVLFDAPFEGGLALRCSAGRGYKMPAHSLINLSHGGRLRAAAGTAALNGHVSSVAPAPAAKFQHSPSSPFHQMAPATASAPPPPTVGGPRRGGGARAEPVGSRSPLLQQPPPPPRAGSGRLRPLLPMPPPPLLPTPGDQFGDIWRQLQRPPPPPAVSPRRTAAQLPVATGAADLRHRPPAPAAGPLHHQSRLGPGGGADQPTSACQRLLDLMQYSDGGVPRYTYSAAPAGKFICTVLLAGGHAYKGAPAPSRDQAAELAARVALHKLGAARATPTALIAGTPAALLSSTAPRPPQQQPQPPQPVKVAQPPARSQPQNGDQVDILSLFRPEVRATLPPSPQPPPPSAPTGDITHSLLSMLSLSAPAPDAAAAPPARAPPHSVANGSPLPAPARDHRHHIGAAPAAHQSASGPQGRAFVPLQVTRQVTPRKQAAEARSAQVPVGTHAISESSSAQVAELESGVDPLQAMLTQIQGRDQSTPPAEGAPGEAGIDDGRPPPAHGATGGAAAAAEQTARAPAEGASPVEAGTVLAEAGAAPAEVDTVPAEAGASRTRTGKPAGQTRSAGSGRLFRNSAPRKNKNRLACKF